MLCLEKILLSFLDTPAMFGMTKFSQLDQLHHRAENIPTKTEEKEN